MDSSKSSNPTGAHSAAAIGKAENSIRHRGHRGGVIHMHRAIARFVLTPADLITAALLVVAMMFLWWAAIPLIRQLWNLVFELGVRYLPLRAEVGIVDEQLPFLHLVMPYPRVMTPLPDFSTWSMTAAAVALMFAATLILPKRLVPVAYLTRGVLFVQTISLIYFAVRPAEFPHSCQDYMAGLLTSSIVLVPFVPVLFGITYYIFEFQLWKKFLLTLITMAHLIVFVPLQILLHSVMLQISVLFMPVLYLVMGVPLDVLIIVAFYSWGMSWKLKSV